MNMVERAKSIFSNAEIIAGLGRVLALGVLMLAMTLISDVFLNVQNLSNIVTNASVMIILGVGQTITIITNGPDLSVGSILTICGVVAAMLVKAGVPLPLVILAALVLGMLLGYLNGFMIAKIGIPSFISTYGLQWAVFGFAYLILKGYVIYDFDPGFRFIGNGFLFGLVPMPIVTMLVVVLGGIFLLRKTTHGRRFHAVGANRDAAHMSGLKTDRIIIQAFVISGFLAALAGYVLVARINAVQADIGVNYLLPVVATVFMGGTSPTGGRGSIVGTVIGALIMTLVENAMNLLAIPSVWRDAIIGALIIITVLVDITTKKRLATSI